MRPRKTIISKEALDRIRKLHDEEITKARSQAILKKDENPSWFQLMQNKSLAFSCFWDEIKGFIDVHTGDWFLIMTDAAKGHELLRDSVDEIEKVTVGRLSSEPKYMVPFSIGDITETINVRDFFYDEEGHMIDIDKEKQAALKYQIKTNIIPIIKGIINEPYPYQERPRIITSNNTDYQPDKVEMLCNMSDHYQSSGNGSFRELVYRLKGMGPLENVIDFKEWLEQN